MIRIACYFLFIIIFSCSVGTKNKFEIGHKFNNLSYISFEGENKSISELFLSNQSPRVNEVVVVFWSMYCGYSRKFLKRINKNFSTNNPVITFLFVNLDGLDDLTKLENFIIQNKLSRFKHAFSGTRADDETYLQFGSPRLPRAFVLNRDLLVTGVYD